MNYEDAYVDCPNIGVRARFVEPNKQWLKGNSYSNPYARSDFSGIDYSALPLVGVHAFTEDLQLYHTYDNSTDASSQCGLGEKYYRVARHINKGFIPCVINGVSIKLLFAQNPLVKGGRKAV